MNVRKIEIRRVSVRIRRSTNECRKMVNRRVSVRIRRSTSEWLEDSEPEGFCQDKEIYQ